MKKSLGLSPRMGSITTGCGIGVSSKELHLVTVTPIVTEKEAIGFQVLSNPDRMTPTAHL